MRYTIFLLFLSIFVFFGSGCTNFFLGNPELGSKARPIKFYIDSTHTLLNNEEAISNLQTCMENKAGYRIRFIYAPDEKSVVSFITNNNAQFGLLSSLSYISAISKASLKNLLVLSSKGSLSNRAVILTNTNFWNKTLQDMNLNPTQSSTPEKILNLLNNMSISLNSPESDVGFFVPRLYFLQHNIFPKSVLFTGSFDTVLQSMDEKITEFGSVSEQYLLKKYPNLLLIQIGNIIGNYTVLALSDRLAGNVIASNPKNSEKINIALIDSLKFCAVNKLADFKKIFDADGVQKSDDKYFTFTKELYSFQQENLRILTPKN